jgi:hypothetical protein
MLNYDGDPNTRDGGGGERREEEEQWKAIKHKS